MNPTRSIWALALVLVVALASCDAGRQRPEPIPGPNGPVADDVFEEAYLRDPPPELRPWVRWWWPGGDVDDARLAEELALLESVGFGGVEIQPLRIGLGDAEIATNPAVRTVGTAAFHAHLRAAMDAAAALDMQVDLTLGSGWPSAAPITADVGERQLFVSALELAGGATYGGPVPAAMEPPFIGDVNAIFEVVGPFDANVTRVGVVAARRTNPGETPPIYDQVLDLAPFVTGDTLDWSVPTGSWTVFSLYANRTMHHGLGSAFPGDATEALVVDHLDPAGFAEYAAVFADPLWTALEGRSPSAVFVDSFELVGDLPWTETFLARFTSELGYDPLPYLPHVFLEGGDSKYTQILRPVEVLARTEEETGWRVREDYERVRGALFTEGFLEPLRAWCDARGVALRLQAHGGWGDVLDDYALADIPESEGLYARGSFDFLSLASSAAHVAGRRFVTSESFVSLGALTMEPADIDRRIARAFAAGVNRTVMHGYASLHVLEDGTRWYPFRGGDASSSSAGPLSFTTNLTEEADLWTSMPAIHARLARLSYAMSRGSRAAQIAWLHPRRELRDSPASGAAARAGESAESRALAAAGLTYDRVSRSMLEGATVDATGLHVGEATFEGLLLTELEAADPALLSALQSIADAGVPVVVVGGLPTRATGWHDHLARDAAVVAASAVLASAVAQVASPDGIAAAFAGEGLLPWLEPTSASAGAPSMAHRRLPSDRLVLLANEEDERTRTTLRWRLPGGTVRGLDTSDGLPLFERELAPGDELTVEVPARGTLLLHLRE